MDENQLQPENLGEPLRDGLADPYERCVRGEVASSDLERNGQERVTLDVRVSSRNGDVLGAMLFVPAHKLESLGYELTGLESVSLSVVANT
jgi:hypothetical protein